MLVKHIIHVNKHLVKTVARIITVKKKYKLGHPTSTETF